MPSIGKFLSLRTYKHGLALMSKWVAANQNEVAEFFGISSQTLKGPWMSRGCPLEKGVFNGVSGYDISAIARWRLQYLAQKRKPTEEEVLLDASSPDADRWKAEWTRNRALLAGEELGKVKGQLIDLDEIAPTLRRAGVVLADGIRRLEAEYGADAADVMRTPLERMREDLESLIDRDNGPADDED